MARHFVSLCPDSGPHHGPDAGPHRGPDAGPHRGPDPSPQWALTLVLAVP